MRQVILRVEEAEVASLLVRALVDTHRADLIRDLDRVAIRHQAVRLMGVHRQVRDTLRVADTQEGVVPLPNLAAQRGTRLVEDGTFLGVNQATHLRRQITTITTITMDLVIHILIIGVCGDGIRLVSGIHGLDTIGITPILGMANRHRSAMC